MSLWWAWWTHSYWFLPLTLAQSHRFFSTLAGICLFWIKKQNKPKEKQTTKKRKKLRTNSPTHTAFFHFALPFAHSHSGQHQSHSLISKSDNSRQNFYIPKIKKKLKRGRGKKDNTHRLIQYMQSEAVFLDDKAFTHGRRGNDTEICRTLLPMRRFLPGNWERVGELQKRFPWRRFQKMSNKNKDKNQMHTYIYIYLYVIIESPSFHKRQSGGSWDTRACL